VRSACVGCRYILLLTAESVQVLHN
jgi:hypothetical protein